MNFKAKILATALLVALMSPTVLSIGISPGTVNFENMFRGGYAEKIMALSNAGDEDLIVNAELTGEAAAWITLEPDMVNETLEAKSALPFKVKLQLHPSVNRGYYTASLVVSTTNMEDWTSGASGARFMPGLIVSINVNITGEELIDYRIKSFTVGDSEEGEPIEYSILVENKGNVKVTPNITLEIVSEDKKRLVLTEEVDAAPVLPTTEEWIKSSISSEGIKKGGYWLRMKAYLKGDLLTEKEVDFKIVEVGAISITGKLTDLIIPREALPGDKVKITAYFNNTSGKTYDVQSLCEVFTLGKFVDTVESKIIRAEAGQSIELPSYYQVASEGGEYEFKCYVTYQNKQTEIVERKVVAEAGSDVGYLLYALIAVMTLLLLYVVYTRVKSSGR